MIDARLNGLAQIHHQGPASGVGDGGDDRGAEPRRAAGDQDDTVRQ